MANLTPSWLNFTPIRFFIWGWRPRNYSTATSWDGYCKQVEKMLNWSWVSGSRLTQTKFTPSLLSRSNSISTLLLGFPALPQLSLKTNFFRLCLPSRIAVVHVPRKDGQGLGVIGHSPNLRTRCDKSGERSGERSASHPCNTVEMLTLMEGSGVFDFPTNATVSRNSQSSAVRGDLIYTQQVGGSSPSAPTKRASFEPRSGNGLGFVLAPSMIQPRNPSSWKAANGCCMGAWTN